MDLKEIEHLYQYYLREIGLKMMFSINEHLVAYDITPPQARIVGFINEKYKKGITICQKDIEKMWKIKGSSVTSLMKGLEKKGYIIRNANETDERVKNLFLTKKGQDLVEEFEQVFNETEKRIVMGMTKQQKDEFLQLLKIVSKNFETK